MNKDSALDPISPRDLSPVVAHFADVIVDRPPPIQRRPALPPRKKPTEVFPREHMEPQPASSALLDAPPLNSGTELEAGDEAWFATSTLAPTERMEAPDEELESSIDDRHLLVAAVVTIASTVALGVSLGALVASLS